MKRTTSILTLAVGMVLLTCSAEPLFDPTAKDDKDVRKTEKQWVEATLRSDVAALERILPDDFTMVGPDGEVSGKAQEIANHRSGDLKFESLTTDGIKVVVYIGGAVVTGRAVVKGKFKDQDISGEYRFTDVFESRKNVWYPIISQLTKVVKEEDKKK